MLGKFLTIILFGCILTVYSTSSYSHEGQQLISIKVRNQDDLKALSQLDRQNELDFINHPGRIDSNVFINVFKHQVPFLNSFIEQNDLKNVTENIDIDRLIEEERREGVQDSTNSISYDITKYHDLADIYASLDHLASKHLNATTFVLPERTHYKRVIKGIKIAGGRKKPIIMINCGVHAREWIAPASCMYIIHKLLSTEPSTHKQMKYLVNNFEWHIIPSINPDGYDYTWTKNRMWRKNLRPSNYPQCFGVDLNRNWDADWSAHVGSTSNVCDYQTYAGPNAFSEPETRSMKNYVAKVENRVMLYFDIHSYSQLWMYPYAYKRAVTVDSVQQNTAAKKGVEALEKLHGTVYKYGATAQTIYPSSGTAPDYFYESQGIKFTFVVELRDTGAYGFALPSRYIDPTASELFAGLQATIEYVKDKF